MVRRSEMVLALVAIWQVAACDGNDETAPDGRNLAGDSGHGGAATSPGGAPLGGSSFAGASHASHASHAGNAGLPSGGSGEAGSNAAGGNGGAAGLANDGGSASGADDGGAPGEGGADSEGGANGEGGANEISGREFVYVSHILGGIVSCSLDSNGVPTPLPSGPIRPSGHATSLAVHPTQKFVYVADEDKHVYVFPIGTDGSLPAEPSSSIATPAYPLSLTIEPQGRFAYVASDQGTAIYGFAIDDDSGALTAVGEPLLVGEGPDFSQPAFIAAEPSGNYVYVSQRAQRGIRGYQIDSSSGTLSELEGSPFAATGLPPGDNLFGGAIVFKASGDFAFTSGGALNAFSLDPRSGALTLVEGSPFTLDVQSDPNAPNLTIDPQGKYLYVSHFLLNNHVSGFAIDATSGKLEAVPGSPITALAPYSAAIDPSGRFLYIGEDLPETSVYRLSRSNGAMTELAGSPFMFGGLEPKLAFAVLP